MPLVRQSPPLAPRAPRSRSPRRAASTEAASAAGKAAGSAATTATASAAASTTRLCSSRLSCGRRRDCACCRLIAGFRTARLAEAFAKFGHFERPVLVRGVIADCDLSGRGREFEHLHADVPLAGSKVHRVAPVLIGIGDDFGIALLRRDHGAGNKLIRRPHLPAVLRRVEPRAAQGENKSTNNNWNEKPGKFLHIGSDPANGIKDCRCPVFRARAVCKYPSSGA